VSKIAIVIPFYQEEYGILRRCLASVIDQKLEHSVIASIIIVNDASPVDPAVDIQAAGDFPPNTTIRMIRRSNGGPGAARNTGLDSVDDDVDFVALLDSDDTWRSDHLERAISSLNAGFDLYFSDHLKQVGGKAYLPSTRFYNSVCKENNIPWREISPNTSIFTCDSRLIAEFAVNEYLAHTSSIVYRASKLGAVRTMEALRAAGEDHLFFLDLALGAGSICFSLAGEISLGTGVNISEKAFIWGSERNLRRRIFNLGALKMMRHRSNWTPPTLRTVKRRIKAMRRTIGFLLLREILCESKIPLNSFRLAWSFDWMTVLLFPTNAMSFMARRFLSRGAYNVE
jgi:succinoglycan biosynthesis protein ExoW